MLLSNEIQGADGLNTFINAQLQTLLFFFSSKSMSLQGLKIKILREYTYIAEVI